MSFIPGVFEVPAGFSFCSHTSSSDAIQHFPVAKPSHCTSSEPKSVDWEPEIEPEWLPWVPDTDPDQQFWKTEFVAIAFVHAVYWTHSQ